MTNTVEWPGAVEYVLDATDVVVEVNETWLELARRYGAPELTKLSLASSVWDAMADDETRAVWHLILDRVRSTGAPLDLSYRCDTAGLRRWWDLRISARPDRSVHFHSSLVRQEARDPVPLPIAGTAPDTVDITTRDDALMCSWCGRFSDGREWLELEDYLARRQLLEELLPPPRLTHGICRSCRSALVIQSDAAR